MFEFTGIDNDLNPGKDFKLLCPDGTRAGKFKNQSNLVDMLCGRRAGQMVSALNSVSSGPGMYMCPGRCTALCSWARHFTLTIPLFAQVYKWAPANLLLGGNPAMD